MKLQEVREIAKKRGITVGKMNKNAVIKITRGFEIPSGRWLAGSIDVGLKGESFREE